MELLIATSNPHKVEEIAAVLRPLGFGVLDLNDAEVTIPEPEEDADTFAGNARLKATAYGKAVGRVCLADDSGLEVDALDGRPGVHSARYSGLGGTRAERDQANNIKLLRELKGVAQAKRTARFVCAMCLADATGQVLAEARGVFEGVIAIEPRGDNGFGYDPLLFLPDMRCTSAELSSEEKNARSHRGEATRKMVDRLRGLSRCSPEV